MGLITMFVILMSIGDLKSIENDGCEIVLGIRLMILDFDFKGLE